jgi:hypothetical protein
MSGLSANPGGRTEEVKPMVQDGIRRVLEAELKCYHCGRSAGFLQREEGTAGAMVLRRTQNGPGALIANLKAARCDRCGGPLYADEQQIVYQYVMTGQDWERPRRGRPRKHRPEEDQARSA